jgi:cell division protein FtsI/penicillin-binding protein 2
MRKSRFPGHSRPTASSGSSPSYRLPLGRDFNSRLKLWYLLLLVLFFLAALKLVYIQILNHPYFAERARSSHVRTRILPAARGTIFDRNGEALAITNTMKKVFLDAKEYRKYQDASRSQAAATHEKSASTKHKKAGPILDPKLAIDKLAGLLRLDKEVIRKLLEGSGRHIILERDAKPIYLSNATEKQLLNLKESMKLSWVGLEPEQKRVYPFRTLAAQTIGFIGNEGNGMAGLEASENKTLKGRDGEESMEVDARGNKIPGLEEVKIDPKPGQNITLTIDYHLQEVAETALAKGVKAADAKGGVALVMDTDNGAILALASQPAFDANDYMKSPAANWTNPAVVGAYEPGSTYKLMVACAVLEEGLPMDSIQVTCTGEKAIGRRTIHCALHDGNRAHGTIGLEKIIEKSCNIGAATLALRLGVERYSKYVKAMGFGKRTGIELAAESPGQVPPVSKWKDITLANIAFGQSISVTPLQLLRAYCVVANGGRLVNPHLIRTPAKENARGVRVLSEKTCKQMREMLVQVVESGTGKAAAVSDYLIAGKTGTAQKPTPEMGFKSGKYIGSFIGFLPGDKPKVAILVLIDEPSGQHYGGVVAAPVFKEIAREALLHLSIPPQRTVAIKPSAAKNISAHAG